MICFSGHKKTVVLKAKTVRGGGRTMDKKSGGRKPYPPDYSRVSVDPLQPPMKLPLIKLLL